MKIKITCISLLVLMLLTTATNAFSTEALRYSGDFGASLIDFHYEEESSQGEMLDSEDGLLPGLMLEMAAISEHWSISGSLMVEKGEVDYIAYPDSSNELSSKTDETITEASLDLCIKQNISETIEIAYIFGVGKRYWDRDIHSLPNISGLDEQYEWPYFSLGVKPTYEINTQSSIDLLVRAKRTFNATLDVEFKEGQYDPVKLDLDDGIGLEFEANWLQRIDQTTIIGIGPYLHLWWFDQSEELTLTINGLPAGSIYEPASFTRSTGIRLFVRKYF